MGDQKLTCKNCGEPIKVYISPNRLSHFMPRQDRVCDRAVPKEVL